MATQNRDKTFSYEWEYSSGVTGILGIFTLVALMGWLVTVALTAIHLFAVPSIPAEAVQGSIAVITSQWGYILGIPLATLGAFYYIGTFGLALWWFDTQHPLILKILTPYTATGVLFSSYFVYLQLVPIGEICPFCMMSAGATVVLFALELVVVRRSDSPPVSKMTEDLGSLITETNYAVVVFPVLMALVTIGALYMVTLLPLPEMVPFA